MQLTTSKRQSSFALLLATICLAAAVSSTAVQPGSVELELPPSVRSLSSSQAKVGSSVFKRHGDHSDEEEEEEHEEHEHEHEHEHEAMEHQDMASIAATMPVEQVQVAEEHRHTHEDASMTSIHTHNHEHTHGHDEGMHESGPSPASVPDASIAGSNLLPLPVWHHHGGHSHGGFGPVKEHLNETALFLSKGPDPLSYIEWDFGYGLGSAQQLRRFTANADVLGGKGMMGVVDGRWRKLFDENSAEQREAIAKDIKSRLPQEEADGPSRHRGLLILHVVTAVLSCFVLLPMALVLRAAHSSLAPLVSLCHLGMLSGSMFLSIIYKALTPRLYPDNAHGSMGWAILWISVVTLGSDVFRLIGQIWGAVSALRSSKNKSTWLPTNGPEVNSGAATSWRDVVGTMLSRNQTYAHTSEAYDALEEQAMLSQEAHSDDATELDVEKHVATRFSSRRSGSGSSSRAGSGSGSPHRVHFDDRTRGASAESLVEPVNWTGSGSTLASNPEQRRGSPAGSENNVMVASPTTTACNTPRNSIFGNDNHLLPPLNTLKFISLWRTQAAQDSPLSPQESTLPPTKLRSTRLDTFRTVLRYTCVVSARSLPILAFATSYTGLAVYTGSCRGGYKNVCLAHGIKGGIFFWFGLLTFGRYLGAYADVGWAWNKRPTPQGNKAVAGWRKNTPSAEFVECAVIFVYGATNTWMERFGAKSGDPYTIKQIQHISIAVMFWFAGLMGMLLETKFIRDMLSFPIAYHHVAAVPLREARRRHNQRSSNSHRSAGNGADEDLDLLVEAQTQPASYRASFNPFPALVIGVTGIAIAAHHQDYVYEVEIHMLWGQLLAGFALLRCLTYFLFWLRPPTASVLPSRPPTEALAAFSLSCGGLVFMLSSEEVSFAAMRSGYGDFMAILNIAVAVVALIFCWITGLMMVKGWAVRREVRRNLYDHENESHSMSSSSNALQLDVAGEEGREPRHMRASVAPAQTAAAEPEPVFVLDDEEDEEEAPTSRPATTK